MINVWLVSDKEPRSLGAMLEVLGDLVDRVIGWLV